MFSTIGEVVKEIAAFLVIITIAENLLSESTYKKYIKLFSGIVLIIIIIYPLTKYIKSNNTMGQIFEEESMKTKILEMDKSLGYINENICKQSIIEYQTCINDKIATDLNKEGFIINNVQTELTVEEDSEEMSVKSIKIYIDSKDEKQYIEVGKIIIGDTKQTNIDDPDEVYIKDYLSDKYSLDKEIISVTKGKN